MKKSFLRGILCLLLVLSFAATVWSQELPGTYPLKRPDKETLERWIQDYESADEPANKPVIGGQCEYKKYRGQAEIISIREKELPNNCSGPSYESYEVKFSFHTDEVIEERYGQVEGEQYLLLLDNSCYLGPKFLQKYGIEVGERFDCYLKVIFRGTCTPVLFDFPTIDLSDYFENQG